MPAVPAKKLPAKKVAATKKAAPRNLPPQIMPLGQGTSQYHRLLIYGEPGTGKTVLLGTAPNSLMLEADRGDVSAAVRGSAAMKWPVSDWENIYDAFYYLRDGGGCKEFQWVTFDTVTMFQDRGLDAIMEDLVAKKPHRQMWAPDKGEYGQNMNRLLRFIRELVDLPIHVAVTAHIMQDTDHEGEYRFMPAVQGKNMSAKLCSHFSLIGHMSMQVVENQEVPVFSTRKDGKYYSKDRYGVIGRMKDPTVPKIVSRIEKGPQG